MFKKIKILLFFLTLRIIQWNQECQNFHSHCKATFNTLLFDLKLSAIDKLN